METPFPSNSNKVTAPKAAPPEKKVEKVTTGEVIHRKKSLAERFKNVFLGADLKSVIRYVAADVLLPALKNMAVDTIEQGAKRAIYGDRAPRRVVDPRAPIISYNTPVDRRYRPQQPAMLPHQPPQYASQRQQQVGEIILASRNEAELVLERLKDILDTYDTASVADLFELVGLPNTHVDHMWGWSNLNFASVRQTRDGYVIDLPAAQPL